MLYRIETPLRKGPQRFATRPGQLSLAEQSAKTVVLKVRSFSCTAHEMDSVMQLVLARGYENLVVDLRGNGGGSLEGGITLGGYLVNEETATGVYLTQEWFRMHPAPPTLTQLDTMAVFTKASVEEFMAALDEQPYVVLKARPGPRHFDGRVFLLTDRRTASACEPLAWNLKHYGRATLVGEPTAGAMLSAESYPVRNGFMAVVPNADFYTPSGERLDLVGVQPHVQVKSADALGYVLGVLGE